jgi:hypothetical protein
MRTMLFFFFLFVAFLPTKAQTLKGFVNPDTLCGGLYEHVGFRLIEGNRRLKHLRCDRGDYFLISDSKAPYWKLANKDGFPMMKCRIKAPKNEFLTYFRVREKTPSGSITWRYIVDECRWVKETDRQYRTGQSIGNGTRDDP